MWPGQIPRVAVPVPAVGEPAPKEHAAEAADAGACKSGDAASSHDDLSRLPGIGLDGSSGHTLLRQFRFAWGMYAPVAASLIAFFAKDMYILKFGANAVYIGVISTAWSVLYPMVFPLAGHLMDHHSWILKWRGWGRRAPWFAVHVLPLSLCMAVFYMPGLMWPPLPGDLWLEVWFAGCMTVAGWCLAVLLNTLESARAEIYPFKEERVRVEALSKYVGIVAAGTGILPQLFLWAVFTFASRLGVSIGLGVCMLASLCSTPTLRDARQPCVRIGARAGLGELLEVLRKPPMFNAAMLRFWHSAADTTSLNFSIYYLTFVNGLRSAERAAAIFFASTLAGVVEVCILTPLWGFVWGKRRGREAADGRGRRGPSMQTFCLGMHLFAAVVPILALHGMPFFGTSRTSGWVVYSLLARFAFSPQSFFRVNSFCWAVDDDCHRGHGVRREAVHAGGVKLFQEGGRSVAIMLLLILGSLGLQTRNCELVCQTESDVRACAEACEVEDIAQQPEAVRVFITAVLTYICPAFSLVTAFYIWRFPISGARLEELQQRQAVDFKDVRAQPPSHDSVEEVSAAVARCREAGEAGPDEAQGKPIVSLWGPAGEEPAKRGRKLVPPKPGVP